MKEMSRLIYLLFLLVILSQMAKAQEFYELRVLVKTKNDKEVKEIELIVDPGYRLMKRTNSGEYTLDSLKAGNYSLTIFSEGYNTIKENIEISNSNLRLEFELIPFEATIDAVVIIDEKENEFGIRRLKPVEGTAIYAGKKSEVVSPEDMAVNTATNNSRQLYGKVAGLNIWESDGAGIQLGIGGRGLNPSRVSNFNTRQNGYDISADALGYPESYYSPPTEAIERIEIVRGAASLQYGTQFGGFLNFKLKEGPEDKKFELISRQTLGSFGLFNSFNSISGNKGKLKYYSYFQYKTGKGWRENSDFDVKNSHTHLSYQLNNKIKIGFEYTYMNYLQQQAGGLTDVMFEQDPQQSIRQRNWFKVDWNLFALSLDYRISDKTDFNFRSFGLLAGRDAVGVLNQITRIDREGTTRDLLSDDYKNIGFENRLLHRYTLFDNTSIFLIGMRYYNGMTDRKQGNGSTASDADFNYLNPNRPEDSKYDFPSQNLSFFTENVFYLSPKISITPGLRFEYISTQAQGYYFNRFIANNGDTLLNEQRFEERENNRNFLLAGIGMSYKPHEKFEFYANFSQNYRSINFNDMRIDNPNYVVDPDLQDEKGFSVDLGIRGNKLNAFNYDISLFLLSYKDRIGTTLRTDPFLFRTFRFRTNISDSRSLGLESFIEVDVFQALGLKELKSKLSVFSNFSLIHAEYINSQEAAFDNKEVELAPRLIFKGGLSYRRERFQLSYQYSYTEQHFTDATNADFSPNAVFGIIPAYAVMDVSAKYGHKKLSFEAGVNNLADAIYFSRRASGYPGPGIIPADPRNFYLTIGFTY